MAQRVNIQVLNNAAVDVTVQNSNAINVEVPTAPRGLSAEFTANKTEIDQFETVDFSATNAGFQYFFSIEDVGGFIFKSGKDVSHEFRNIGQFDVALTQADLNQKASGIQVKRDFIKVNQAPFLLNQPFSVGATAAYSLRKLKSSATKAVRVREDASNTETDIGFSGAILDETALLNHCGSANGFVTKWYDQSGNGNDAFNSTASEQPQIVSGGSVVKENGKPALEFDGSDDFLQSVKNISILNDDVRSYIAVTTIVTDGGSIMGFGKGQTQGASDLLLFGGNYYFWGKGADFNTNKAIDFNKHNQHSVKYNQNSEITWKENNNLLASGKTSQILQTPQSPLNLGKRTGKTAFAEIFLSEAIMYPLLLSGQEETNIFQNQENFYGGF